MKLENKKYKSIITIQNNYRMFKAKKRIYEILRDKIYDNTRVWHEEYYGFKLFNCKKDEYNNYKALWRIYLNKNSY